MVYLGDPLTSAASHTWNISVGEQWLIDRTSESFLNDGKWPKSEKLIRDAARKQVDLPEINYGVSKNDFLWRPDIDGTLVLSLTGLWRSAAGQDFVKHFLQVALLCRDIYLGESEGGEDEQPKVSSDDLRSQFGFDDAIIRLVFTELSIEYYLTRGATNTSNTDWSYLINPRVKEFRNVSTIEEYFEVRAKVVAPSTLYVPPNPLTTNYLTHSSLAVTLMDGIMGTDSPKMKSVAQPFYRAAMMAFEHARLHSSVNDDMDAAQVVLSLDFGVEMLLKAVFLDRDKSIMTERGRQSLGLHEILKEFRSYKNVSAVEVLRERRNGLQHFAAYTDVNTTQDHYEATLLFVGEVMERDFNQKPLQFPQDTSTPPQDLPLADLVWDVEQLQRDIDVSDAGIIVWAQGNPDSASLAVFMKQGVNEPVRLTPENEFEYMPKTYGNQVVCYRQSGGIILYNIETGDRTPISEAGCPTAINEKWIAGQGLETENGLGGGIWIWDRTNSNWMRVSETGDSARLTDNRVVWQELESDALAIKYRELDGEEVKTVTTNGTHPSPFGELIAWTDWKGDASLHVTRFDGTEIYVAQNAVFPCLRGNFVAYLQIENDIYSLVIDEVTTGDNVLRLPSVGFPMGNGIALAQDAVFFESKTNRPVHAIWRKTIEPSI